MEWHLKESFEQFKQLFLKELLKKSEFHEKKTLKDFLKNLPEYLWINFSWNCIFCRNLLENFPEKLLKKFLVEFYEKVLEEFLEKYQLKTREENLKSWKKNWKKNPVGISGGVSGGHHGLNFKEVHIENGLFSQEVLSENIRKIADELVQEKKPRKINYGGVSLE